MKISLLGKYCRDAKVSLLISFTSVMLFEFLLVQIYASFNFGDIFGAFMEMLPPAFKAFWGGGVLDFFSVKGYMAVGFTHPMIPILFCAFAIGLSTRVITYEIERGTMGLLLSLPCARKQVMATAAIVITVGVALICLAAMFGFVIGSQLLHVNMHVVDAFRPTFASFFLWMAIASYSLLFSTLTSERGRALGWSIGLTSFMYIWDFVAKVWTQVEFLKPYSVFHYYDPVTIISSGNINWNHIVVLTILSILLTTAAFVVFQKRDIK